MYLFFDESGDYAFPDDRFDCYVQAALICPDSQIDALGHFVDDRKNIWGVRELHASELASERLLEVAQFIGHSPCQLLAHLTDSMIVTAEQISQFRLDQAATIRRNLEWYRAESTKARGGPVEEIEQWMLRQIKRAGLASQISHGEFVQAHYLIELITAALQKSLLVYAHDSWRDDFHEFHFILDGKLPRKMAAGEKYLGELIVPVLGSRRGSRLVLADSWKEKPRHPFVERFERARGRVRGEEIEGVIDLKALFHGGLRFESSTGHAGLQLVDSVAHIVRRAVLQRDDDLIQAAFHAFRAKLRNDNGGCLTIQRLRVGDADPSCIERYRHLYGSAPAN